MTKKAPIVLSLIFLANVAAAETRSYFDVKFRSVDCKVVASSTTLYFEWVHLNSNLYDIAVLLDKIEVVLQPNATNYTTLDVINVEKIEKNSLSSTLGAEKIIVRVRNEKDFLIWQKYLARLRRKQDEERERWLRPTRVLPPP